MWGRGPRSRGNRDWRCARSPPRLTTTHTHTPSAAKPAPSTSLDVDARAGDDAAAAAAAAAPADGPAAFPVAVRLKDERPETGAAPPDDDGEASTSSSDGDDDDDAPPPRALSPASADAQASSLAASWRLAAALDFLAAACRARLLPDPPRWTADGVEADLVACDGGAGSTLARLHAALIRAASPPGPRGARAEALGMAARTVGLGAAVIVAPPILGILATPCAHAWHVASRSPACAPGAWLATHPFALPSVFVLALAAASTAVTLRDFPNPRVDSACGEGPRPDPPVDLLFVPALRLAGEGQQTLP